ncbi:MAG: hypothetical protein B7C24_03760 [Bacteroidetes bacterium 4572_77]|nr:MAG: hypothetical protein B7C24_03760 [Bacteroidetes bacterium 4572_77]
MEEITSKERILKAIRNGLMTEVKNSYTEVNAEKAVMKPLEESIDFHFAQELSALGGKFIFCESEEQMLQTLKLIIKEEDLDPLFCVNPELQHQLSAAQIPFIFEEKDFKKTKSSLSACEFLIARFGSVLMSAGLPSGRKIHAWPEVHLVKAYASQLVPEISDAIIGMRERYNGVLPSMMTMVTGASRTADIEKTLVMGAHGPRELYVFFIDDLLE